MATNTITSLTAASTIDAAQDYLPIDTASVSATQKINRNTLLNLTSQPVGLTDTQTLTNKTLTSPTISGPTFSGTIIGTYTIGGTPTFPSSVVTLTGTQTLTNKTLTSPTINSPTITNATISADTVTGYTVSNTGTIYGISVSAGVISTAGSVGSGANATNGVQAAALATNAITLGLATITSGFTTTNSAATQVTGLTLTVTIPSGGRKIRIMAYCPQFYNTTSTARADLSIWDGVVGSGTQLQEAFGVGNNSFSAGVGLAVAYVTPSAGSKTYNVGLRAENGGTATLSAAATTPSYLVVEAV